MPVVTCPRCRRAAEYHATIELLDPPVGQIDTGYCTACACLFEQVRSSGIAYDSTAWPPVCRTCRQPVAATAVTASGADVTVQLQCREHPTERWHWLRPTDRWTRAD